jgi:glutathione synthase/RimK-type ligase-like ATP-grasp enzyme
MLKIGLATCSRVPDLTADDRLLQDELRRRGAEARPVVWDDASIAWGALDRVVIRSCWDYHLRTPEFLCWLSSLEESRVPVWNPPALVRANVDKSYLRILAAAGVPVLPTSWLARGSRVNLAEVLDAQGWHDAVVKPAVSASAHRTWRASRPEALEQQPTLDALLAAGDVLVQSYAPEIGAAGEWSFVFLGGGFSHAVLKRPAAGDFRVQEEFGGQALALSPPSGLLEQARTVVARIDGPWLYARVDGIERDGTFILMELELTEPVLFLAKAPGAAPCLADAIMG